MKLLIFTTMVLFSFSSFAQNTAYNDKGKKRRISSQLETITLSSSTVKLTDPKTVDPNKFVGATEIVSFAKEIFNVAYNISVGIAEGRIKKFSSEYEKEVSVIDDNRTIPNINFERSVEFRGNKTPASGSLKMTLTAHKVANLNYFYYSVDKLHLSASKAKTTKNSNRLDYSVVLQLTFLVDTTIKTITTAPFQIKSAKFDDNIYPNSQHRSDLIPLPEKAHILKVGIKIVESNPKAVDAQRNLDTWKKIKTENEDALEKIFKVILETKEES